MEMTGETWIQFVRFDYCSRTLLNNIQGFADMLADPALQLDEKTRLEYAEIISASTTQLVEEQRFFISCFQWY